MNLKNVKLVIVIKLEHVGTKEITVNLLNILKHTFRKTTYSKVIRFGFTMQYPKNDGIEIGGG